jgi:hypothetical protein
MRRILAPGALMLAAACSNSNLSNPVNPFLPTATAPPTNAFFLNGVVYDTAFRLVPQARVEAVAGPQAGAVTTADDHGEFSFGTRWFTGGLTVSASKDGYATSSQTVIPDGRTSQSVTFTLAAAGPSLDLAGTFDLTVTVDAACNGLPANLRTRRYTATFVRERSEWQYVATLTGASFAAPSRIARYDRFQANVFGDVVRFVFRSDDELNGIVEEVDPDTYVGIVGNAELRVASFPIEASLSGEYSYCEAPRDGRNPVEFECGSIPIVCSGSTHRLTLRRQ